MAVSLLVEETRVPGENCRTIASHWQTISHNQGRIQDFKLGGGALKKIAPSGGRREIFGVFRVKNHDFTPKNHIFSNFRGGARRVRPPPLDPPLIMLYRVHLSWTGFESTALVVIGTDCIGNCISNYHTITPPLDSKSTHDFISKNCKYFQNPIEKSREAKSIPLTHKYMIAHVKASFWTQTSPLSKMKWSCKCFHMRLKCQSNIKPGKQ